MDSLIKQCAADFVTDFGSAHPAAHCFAYCATDFDSNAHSFWYDGPEVCHTRLAP